MNLRILALLFLSTTVNASIYDSQVQNQLHDLDLTIPEQPAVYVERKRYLNLGDFDTPPSKCQMTLFWTLNVLDVWSTVRALDRCPTCTETNPLLPKKPTLEELLLQKAIIGGTMHYFGSADYITVMNTTLIYVVHNNYNLVE